MFLAAQVRVKGDEIICKIPLAAPNARQSKTRTEAFITSPSFWFGPTGPDQLKDSYIVWGRKKIVAVCFAADRRVCGLQQGADSKAGRRRRQAGEDRNGVSFLQVGFSCLLNLE